MSLTGGRVNGCFCRVATEATQSNSANKRTASQAKLPGAKETTVYACVYMCIE